MPIVTKHRSVLGLTCLAAILSTACATPAELRKLDHRLADLERKRGAVEAEATRGRLADLGAQVTALQRSVDSLNGRFEVIERRLEIAVEEARAARLEAHQGGGPAPGPGGDGTEPGIDVTEEVQSYRDAYAEWRAGDAAACVDRFGKFLQTYPASEYADDATYWLGDCYFKQGNFSAAVLRFDDVARQYPEGNKAADALYRQGEALLRMGHGTAAGNAFEKVLRDYPSSARASEAKRQLDLLQAG